MKTLPSLIKLVVFIVVTVLATGLLAATIGNLRFGGTTSYQALFTDATGLLKGDDVRIAGVRVGETLPYHYPRQPAARKVARAARPRVP